MTASPPLSYPVQGERTSAPSPSSTTVSCPKDASGSLTETASTASSGYPSGTAEILSRSCNLEPPVEDAELREIFSRFSFSSDRRRRKSPSSRNQANDSASDSGSDISPFSSPPLRPSTCMDVMTEAIPGINQPQHLSRLRSARCHVPPSPASSVINEVLDSNDGFLPSPRRRSLQQQALFLVRNSAVHVRQLLSGMNYTFRQEFHCSLLPLEISTWLPLRHHLTRLLESIDTLEIDLAADKPSLDQCRWINSKFCPTVDSTAYQGLEMLTAWNIENSKDSASSVLHRRNAGPPRTPTDSSESNSKSNSKSKSRSTSTARDANTNDTSDGERPRVNNLRNHLRSGLTSIRRASASTSRASPAHSPPQVTSGFGPRCESEIEPLRRVAVTDLSLDLRPDDPGVVKSQRRRRMKASRKELRCLLVSVKEVAGLAKRRLKW